MMNLRFLLQSYVSHSARCVCLVLVLASTAASADPFDITLQTARDVVVWIDNNVSDPSSVGNDLEFAFNGAWVSDGVTGTVTVAKDDVIAAFATSGLPGTPADTAGWSDLVITVDIATGAISSMSQSGTLAISGLGDQPFSYDLNTTQFDTTNSSNYTQTGFADVSFGPEIFTGWCSDANAGQISGLACPPYLGPAPFSYDSASGRFNAIGATNLNNVIFAYSTFGDALFLEDVASVPSLSQTSAALLVIAMGASSLFVNRHRARKA